MEALSFNEDSPHWFAVRELGILAQLKTDASPGIPELLEFADPDGYLVQLYPEMSLKKHGLAGKKQDSDLVGTIPSWRGTQCGYVSLRSGTKYDRAVYGCDRSMGDR